MNTKFRFITGFFLMLILSFWTVRALFDTGYFPMHDDTQVSRVIVMGKALRQRQFPVRWVSDLGYGYGYPIFNFYAPLPYYAGGGLFALGVDSIVATKVMFLLGAVLAAVFMYVFLYPITGLLGAVLGSIVFTYAPYHAEQIYIRGAVGEYWALAFIPVLCIGLHMIFRHATSIRGVIIAGAGLAGVILSHTILGFLTTAAYIGLSIVLLVVLVINRKVHISTLAAMGFSICVGLGLSAFFWIPAFTEMQYTNVSAMITGANTNFFDHFVCTGQLWNSPWGYAGSAPGCINDGMSFKLGKIHILFSLLTIGLFIYFQVKKQKHTYQWLFLSSVLLLVVSVAAVLPVSAGIWRLFPYVSFIQYPWRILSYSIFSTGIIISFTNVFIKNSVIRKITVACMLVSVLLLNAKLFRPQYSYYADASSFENPADLRYRISKISDEYLPPGIPRPSSTAEVNSSPLTAPEGVIVTIQDKSDTMLKAQVESDKSADIRINTAYFSGWNYFVNGVRVTPVIFRQLPSVHIPSGKTIIEARFTNTQVRSVGNILSVCTVLVVLGLLHYGSKTNS